MMKSFRPMNGISNFSFQYEHFHFFIWDIAWKKNVISSEQALNLQLLYDHMFKSFSPCKLIFWKKKRCFGCFDQIRPTSGSESDWNCKKTRPHVTTFRLNICLSIYDLLFKSSSSNPYKLMFWKKQCLGYFYRIRPVLSGHSGRNCQRAHLHALTFHLNI